MKILADPKTGYEYEHVSTETRDGELFLIIKEIKKQKTFSWDGVSYGVLVRFNQDETQDFLLTKGNVEAEQRSDRYNLRFSSEWNVWRGGKCPFPNCVMVEYELRDRRVITKTGDARELNWSETSTYYSIIAYRVIGLAEGYVYPDKVKSNEKFRVFFHASIEMSSGKYHSKEFDSYETAKAVLDSIADYTLLLHKEDLMTDDSNYGLIEELIEGKWQDA